MANLLKFFPLWIPALAKRNQDLVKSPGYWKTCFKLEKMAEKQPKSSEREVHHFVQFIVSLAGAMYFGLKCTMANWSKFFLCGFQGKQKEPRLS